MKKEKSTKEKILEALEDRKSKIVKWKTTQKDCDELNELAKRLGLDKFPNWKPHKPQEFEVLIK
mgnify:FL=1